MLLYGLSVWKSRATAIGGPGELTFYSVKQEFARMMLMRRKDYSEVKMMLGFRSVAFWMYVQHFAGSAGYNVSNPVHAARVL